MPYDQTTMSVIASNHGVAACPFCGHWPDIADDETGFGIFCRNPECTIQPGLYLDNEEESDGRKPAIDTWNKRAESRAQEEGDSTEAAYKAINRMRDNLAAMIKERDQARAEVEAMRDSDVHALLREAREWIDECHAGEPHGSDEKAEFVDRIDAALAAAGHPSPPVIKPAKGDF